MTLYLTILLILLVSILLWILIGVRGCWVVKSGAIALTMAYATWYFYALNHLKGWPTDSIPPNNFRLHWVLIDEPQYVYLWSTTEENIEPRSYKVKYSRQLHIQAQQAQDMLMAGKVVMGQHGRRGLMAKEAGDGTDGEGDHSGAGKDGGKDGGKNSKIGLEYDDYDGLFFYVLPPPELPRKDTK